jgi:hypothetical protein
MSVKTLMAPCYPNRRSPFSPVGSAVGSICSKCTRLNAAASDAGDVTLGECQNISPQCGLCIELAYSTSLKLLRYRAARSVTPLWPNTHRGPRGSARRMTHQGLSDDERPQRDSVRTVAIDEKAFGPDHSTLTPKPLLLAARLPPRQQRQPPQNGAQQNTRRYVAGIDVLTHRIELPVAREPGGPQWSFVSGIRRLRWTRTGSKVVPSRSRARDRQAEAEGKADKAAGKVQREVGKAKDAIRDTFKK